MSEPAELARVMLAAAEAAMAAILAIGSPGAPAHKADGSPVTAADLAAEAAILTRLTADCPALPVVSEENAASHARPPAERFLLVDPLDGTRELVAGRPEFTVNVALIEHGRPLLGVVGAPLLGEITWTDGQGGVLLRDAAGTRQVRARPAPASGLVAAVSRSHGDAETRRYLAGQPIARQVVTGSSLKFCLLARGEADLYARFGPTMEWDTAAGDAVLRAAGGRMTTPGGDPFLYGKPGYRNGPFVARGAA